MYLKFKSKALFREFTLIRLRFVLVVLLAFLSSCQGPTTKAKEQEILVTKSVNDGENFEESIVLNKANSKAFLTNYGQKLGDSLVEVSTKYGDIIIRLYNNTPLHKANFRYLMKRGYFSETWFYRVSKGHVIQAGNTDDRATVKKRNTIGDYKVPAEIVPTNYHKYGAVAAARSYAGNPEKESDPFEFYIVLGKAYNANELNLLAEKHDFGLTNEALTFYTNRKGAPHLDGQHTVFGEVVEGMEVVEAISHVDVDGGEWPLMNIPIKLSLKAK